MTKSHLFPKVDRDSLAKAFILNQIVRTSGEINGRTPHQRLVVVPAGRPGRLLSWLTRCCSDVTSAPAFRRDQHERADPVQRSYQLEVISV